MTGPARRRAASAPATMSIRRIAARTWGSGTRIPSVGRESGKEEFGVIVDRRDVASFGTERSAPAASVRADHWPVTGRAGRLALFALSAGGVAFTAVILRTGFQSGQFGGANDYTGTFAGVGDLVRAGGNPYASGFVYSPPIALVFAAISWMPIPVVSALVLGAEILALRYIVGSWLGVGLAGWFPLLAFELPLGNLNLVLGACIVAAVRGHGWAGITGGLIKLSPVLAIRDWRGAAWGLVIALLVTLPWLIFWPGWIRNLLAALPAGGVGGPMIPVLFAVRAVIAVGLLIIRRPWATALACVLAIPAFHYQTLLLLIVPIAVWFRGRQEGSAPADPAGGVGGAPSDPALAVMAG